MGGTSFSFPTVVPAASETYTPTGTISAATVQAAIDEAALEALQVSNNLSDPANLSTARTNLMAITPVASSFPYFTGTNTMSVAILPLIVGNGGTGAATAAAARTNLGLVIGTDVQAYDNELNALSAVVPVADSFPYWTGTNTASVAVITSAGFALLDDAAASNQRTTLGLAIGTDVQAWDEHLDDLATVVPIASTNSFPYWSNTNTVTVANVSTSGLNTVTATSTVAIRTVLSVVQTALGAPTPAVGAKGDRWFDTTNNLDYISDGTVWVCVTPQSAIVATSETTTNTNYVDLATSGPAVTITTGTKALVTIGAQMSNDTLANSVRMSFAVTGATTVAAADTAMVGATSAIGGAFVALSKTVYVTGLTAGANTFTAKYRVPATIGTFLNRTITVEGIPF